MSATGFQDQSLDRALPSWAVDLMLNGLNGKDAHNPRKVWAEILRLSMSAYRRGWTEAQFCAELTKDQKKRALRNHRLWAQLREGCSDVSAYRQLHKAWGCAVANVNDVGERTHAELQAEAVELAYRWADRITDAGDQLSEAETAVLLFVASETERRAMPRVTCPARAVAQAAKTSPMTASRSLNALADRGFLFKHSPGRASGKTTSRRAAIYGLADPEALPLGGNRPGGRSPTKGGT